MVSGRMSWVSAFEKVVVFSLVGIVGLLSNLLGIPTRIVSVYEWPTSINLVSLS